MYHRADDCSVVRPVTNLLNRAVSREVVVGAHPLSVVRKEVRQFLVQIYDSVNGSIGQKRQHQYLQESSPLHTVRNGGQCARDGERDPLATPGLKKVWS